MHPVSSPGLALDSDSGPVIAIIPARYQSSRLPGKALADIGGRPMIEHISGAPPPLRRCPPCWSPPTTSAFSKPFAGSEAWRA